MNSTRIFSIDILRGLTIFIMLLGNLSPDLTYTYTHFIHRGWIGISIIDLSFPSFVFIMGISLVFSRSFSMPNWLTKIFCRSLLLFLFGLLINLIPFIVQWVAISDYTLAQCLTDLSAGFRPLGVLQRLALCYFIGGILYKSINTKGKLIIFSFLLMLFSTASYHLYDLVNPYSELDNMSIYIDQITLGTAHTYLHAAYDPEGLWGTINTVATFLLGTLAGILLKDSHRSYLSNQKFIKMLLVFGITMLITGWLWSYVEIISKPLWTAPYVLTVAGINALLLGFLEFIGHSLHNFFQPFIAIGRNPLFIYIFTEITISILYSITYCGESLYTWIYHTYFFNPAFPFATTLLYVALWLGLCILISEIMLKKNMIIKI